MLLLLNKKYRQLYPSMLDCFLEECQIKNIDSLISQQISSRILLNAEGNEFGAQSPRDHFY